MKYALIIALFAILALANAHPTKESSETQSSDAGTDQHAAETTQGEQQKMSSGVSEATKSDTTTENAETSAQTESDDKCVPGTSFQRDCNTCTCPENGSRSLSACTLKLCPTEGSEKKETETKTE